MSLWLFVSAVLLLQNYSHRNVLDSYAFWIYAKIFKLNYILETDVYRVLSSGR
jgi:hypothetical protein